MTSILIRHCAAAFGAALVGIAAAAAQTVAVTNGRLLMAGDDGAPRTIENGTVLIRDGRIVEVGRNVQLPAGGNVRVIDANGQAVTPGLFAPLSGLGLEEISLNREGNDRSPRGSTPLSASLMARDGFYADTTIIPISRAGGVTRAFAAIDPGSDLFGGCGTLVHLGGGASPIVKDCAAHLVALGYSGAAKAQDSRPAAIAQFRRALDDAREYEASPSLYRSQAEQGRLPARDAEALGPVIRGELPLLVQVNGASDILRVLDLGEEYGLDLVLVGAAEAHRVARDIAAADVPVIMLPTQNLPSRFEQLGATLAAAGRLESAGVRVAFYDDDIGYTHNLRLLPQMAGNAVAHGMSYDAALAAITHVPAEIFGVGDRMGRLAPGMVADVVVWDGDPLELSSRPVHVLIDGRETSLDNRQKALARRYRDLERGDLPLAYRGGD
jgi:imidazolonepropionase-like amidohydrolase